VGHNVLLLEHHPFQRLGRIARLLRLRTFSVVSVVGGWIIAQPGDGPLECANG
jgi:hypothetical protein